MSDFKNKLIEKYTEYFILNNPSYNKDDQATTDFCNEKLEQYYVPYINYIENKRKMSKDKEVELENLKANTSVSYRERLFKIGFLCSMSIFSERPSLKTYTDELKGFDEIRFYFDVNEFQNSIIPFLDFEIEINFIELIQILEQNREVNLINVMLSTINIERMELKKDIINLKDKKSYNAQNPRAKKENEIEFENLIKNIKYTHTKSEEEVTESIFKELKSDVKSKTGMENLEKILNQIINPQKGTSVFSKSIFFNSIQAYIYLLFDNDQNGIKRKEKFDAQNNKRKEDEYDGDYKRYYNKRIDSLIFKK